MAKTRSQQSSSADADKKRAEISWEGDTHDVIKSWPRGVREDFGLALRQMQDGYAATLDVRPMPSIGPGVFELKTADERTWYRLVYLARIRNVIYVLDCFEKDSRKTERKDLRLAMKRFQSVQRKLTEERRDEKRKQ